MESAAPTADAARPDAPSFALAHVAVPAADIGRSRAFYELLGATAGFTRLGPDRTPVLVQMRLGESFVELIRPADGVVSTGAGHLALRTDDIDRAWHLLRAAGHEPKAPPRRGESGVMWFFVDDPAGNAVEIVAPIGPGDA